MREKNWRAKERGVCARVRPLHPPTHLAPARSAGPHCRPVRRRPWGTCEDTTARGREEKRRGETRARERGWGSGTFLFQPPLFFLFFSRGPGVHPPPLSSPSLLWRGWRQVLRRARAVWKSRIAGENMCVRESVRVALSRGNHSVRRMGSTKTAAAPATPTPTRGVRRRIIAVSATPPAAAAAQHTRPARPTTAGGVRVHGHPSRSFGRLGLLTLAQGGHVVVIDLF